MSAVVKGVPVLTINGGVSHTIGNYRYALRNKEKFVRLCIKHHKAIHAIMDLLGLQWNEIVDWVRNKNGATEVHSTDF